MWSPGQVLEKVVGFDVALMVHDVSFWALHGYSAVPGGAAVLRTWWPSMLARAALVLRPPPKFRLNVFLQYKRPEHLTGARCSEWSHWKAPYYRFFLTSHQQTALEACASSLGTNGLVAYGSPAFHKRADLFDHVEKRTLIANTHFARVSNLSGHERYTYVSASKPGQAHSEPVRIDPLNFDGHEPPRPPFRPGDPPGDDPPDPLALLEQASRAATAAATASPAIVGTLDLFEAAVGRAETLVRGVQGPDGEPYERALRAFVRAMTFSRMANVQWLAMP